MTEPVEPLWYHIQDLPGIGVVGQDVGEAARNPWDLRGREDAYLGGVDVRGKRVLEIGPASGFWTATLEKRGASVLALEIDDAHAWDFVPNAAVDMERLAAERAVIMARLKRSWHVAKRAYGLAAEIVYGHAEQPPTDRGRFDVTLLGAVLLHTRHPLTILERCATLTDQAVIVVERHWPELGSAPLQRLVPSVEDRETGTWWDFTPSLFETALRLVGFSDVRVTYHEAPVHGLMMPLFTVVGRRRGTAGVAAPSGQHPTATA
jgi:O-methyltransferase